MKAFRDTWRDGIHSYLSYLRDRLEVARDLLTDSGSVFVQIGEENSHLLRAVLDEVFGSHNFVSQIVFSKTASATSEYLAGTYDVLLFYARDRARLKYRQPLQIKEIGGVGGTAYRRARLADGTERALTRSKSCWIPLGCQKTHSCTGWTTSRAKASVGRRARVPHLGFRSRSKAEPTARQTEFGGRLMKLV